MTSAVTLVIVSPPDDTAQDLALLDPGECARAGRFTVDHPRRIFIAARAALRRTLGERLGRDPASLTFTVGPHGKPYLKPAGETPASTIRNHFNLSHSGNTIVIALTEGVELGVDVEELDRDTPTERLARRFFTQAESRAVEQAPEEDRNRVFFHCWTAKEAVLKANGTGLADLSRCKIDGIIDGTRIAVAFRGKTWMVEHVFFNTHVASVTIEDYTVQWDLPDGLKK